MTGTVINVINEVANGLIINELKNKWINIPTRRPGRIALKVDFNFFDV